MRQDLFVLSVFVSVCLRYDFSILHSKRYDYPRKRRPLSPQKYTFASAYEKTEGRKSQYSTAFLGFGKSGGSQNYLKILMHTAFFEVGCMFNDEPTREIVAIDAVTVIQGR